MPAPPPSPSSWSRRCARNFPAFLSFPPFFLPGLFGRFRRLVVVVVSVGSATSISTSSALPAAVSVEPAAAASAAPPPSAITISVGPSPRLPYETGSLRWARFRGFHGNFILTPLS